jgi:hypothetical protein
MLMTPEVAQFLAQYGLPLTMLVVVVTTGARGIWVWGRELKAAELRVAEADARTVKEERRANQWQRIALKALDVGEKVATVAGADDEH